VILEIFPRSHPAKKTYTTVLQREEQAIPIGERFLQSAAIHRRLETVTMRHHRQAVAPAAAAEALG